MLWVCDKYGSTKYVMLAMILQWHIGMKLDIATKDPLDRVLTSMSIWCYVKIL